jgi:predicted dehydrogenase
MLARPDIQAVAIVTGADTHAALTIAAAEHGKDILVEKPLALTVEDARAATQAAERAGIRLQVGFMRRYDPAYRAAYEAIERGELGTPVLFMAISRDMQPPTRNYLSSVGPAGLFTDSGVHDFDAACWLMRDEVESVSATGALVARHDLADLQPIDAAVATLRFRNGALGTIQLYRNAVYGYDIRTEVVGTNGSVVVGDHRRVAATVLQPEGLRQPIWHHWLDRFGDAYALEIADWVQRMSSGEPAAVTGQDGIRALALALAAEESRRTGRAVQL